jgi:hypothetical protein
LAVEDLPQPFADQAQRLARRLKLTSPPHALLADARKMPLRTGAR